MNITKGAYKATITKNGKDGGFFAVVTYEGRGVPGIAGKSYSTKAAAERGAKAMLGKC